MADMQPGQDIQRRVEKISALAARIAAQEQIAVKLMVFVVRAFYTFFTLACLVGGITFLVRGHRDAGYAWGGAGIVLALIWLGVFASSKISRRAMQALRSELTDMPGLGRSGKGRHRTASGH